MKYKLLTLLIISQLILSCGLSADSGKKITVNFDFDKSNASSWKNIYVIWLENDEGKMQPLYVCERLLDNSITDSESALPFWHLNRYDETDQDLMADVDAVTGPTKANRDFSVSAGIDESLGDRFTLYFEIDQSFNFNDWFPGQAYDMRDQPSVLYAAEIDLSKDQTEYDLEALGFVPMYDFNKYGNFSLTAEDQKVFDEGKLAIAKGELFREIRYITHSMSRNNGRISFGPEDEAQSAIRSVAGISATIR